LTELWSRVCAFLAHPVDQFHLVMLTCMLIGLLLLTRQVSGKLFFKFIEIFCRFRKFRTIAYNTAITSRMSEVVIYCRWKCSKTNSTKYCSFYSGCNSTYMIQLKLFTTTEECSSHHHSTPFSESGVDRLQFKGLISLLATLSNNMDVFVIF